MVRSYNAIKYDSTSFQNQENRAAAVEEEEGTEACGVIEVKETDSQEVGSRSKDLKGGRRIEWKRPDREITFIGILL